MSTHQLITSSFQNRRTSYVHFGRPMTDDEVGAVAPSVFADGAHSSRSARYGFISTRQILGGLRQAGFAVVAAGQTLTRCDDRTPFTKHMLRLRHPSRPVDTEADEVVLLNAHDGSSSFQLMLGLFRFFCTNSLVCGEGVIDLRAAHSLKAVSTVVESATALLSTFESVREQRDSLRAVSLTPIEQERFAARALALRYPGGHSPITAEQANTARRAEDHGPALWTVFNRVQENLFSGGLAGKTLKGRETRSRPVKAVTPMVRLNRDLWNLATETRDELLAA